MNIKDYISSGILEAYVAGILNDQERSEVEGKLREHPALKEALSEIEETQEALLLRAAIQPKPAIKVAVFNRINNERSIKPFSDYNLSWKFAAAASIAVAILASYLAFDYRTRWKSASTQLIALQAQNQRVAQEYNTVNKKLDNLANDIQVIENPDFTRVVLKGTSNAPEAQALVYWNPSSSELFLRVQNMKALTDEQQYQLWAIIDGKPVDAGIFDAGNPALIKMKDVGAGALTFAVTVEPRGGKASPTLETMQVAGNVSKS